MDCTALRCSYVCLKDAIADIQYTLFAVDTAPEICDVADNIRIDNGQITISAEDAAASIDIDTVKAVVLLTILELVMVNVLLPML